MMSKGKDSRNEGRLTALGKLSTLVEVLAEVEGNAAWVVYEGIYKYQLRPDE